MPKQLLRKRQNHSIRLKGYDALVNYSARRRTLTIRVAEGQVSVRAPEYVRLHEIEQFLQAKQAWIAQKLAQQHEQLQARQRRWESGAALPLLGKTLRLQIHDASPRYTHLDGDILSVGLRLAPAQSQPLAERVQKQVQQWYKQQALAHFGERVAYWEGVTGITSSGYNVRTYKSRWGTCSHRHELTFNWKLMMAPLDVVDYVVVHELCHIVHFDHSPAFWRLVGRFVPNYKAHKAWLRNNGLSLEL